MYEWNTDLILRLLGVVFAISILLTIVCVIIWFSLRLRDGEDERAMNTVAEYGSIFLIVALAMIALASRITEGSL